VAELETAPVPPVSDSHAGVRCADCGAGFVHVHVRGAPRRFCAECSTSAAYSRRWRARNPDAAAAAVARQAASRRVLPREARCPTCGVSFSQRKAQQRFCSRSCRPSVVELVCEFCSERFEGRAREGQRWCSKRCALLGRPVHPRRAADGKRP
jgi:uncharacterized protein (DUF849 family)